MADQNRNDYQETIGEIVIDFGEICRFCLSETKSDLSINDKSLWEGSTGLKGESMYNFLTKLNFIKMNNSENFPLHVCENCFSLVKLCHDFGQMCQKSDSFLKTCYENSLKETETKNKTSVKDPSCQEFLDSEHEEFPQTIKNVSTVLDEINKIKKTCSGQKLTDSVTVLKTYKQKLTLLSERIKKAHSKLTHISSGEKLIVEPIDEESLHSCSLCSQKFKSSRALNSHYVTVHNQKRLRTSHKFQCKNCLKLFSFQEKLKRHYKVIHKLSEPPEDYLNNRVSQLTQVGRTKFFCFNCTPFKEFQFQDHLTDHFNAFHRNEATIDSKTYSCAHCNSSSFPTMLSLNQHLSLVHKLGGDNIILDDPTITQDPKPPRVLLCVPTKTHPQCEKQSRNLTELSAFLGVLDSVVDSLNVIQGETGLKVMCKNCNPQAEFTSASDFVNHIQTHHGKPKIFENWGTDGKSPKKEGPWNCSECPASYSRKRSLQCHLKEKHKQANVGGMKCPDCPERFATNRQLIQHGINTHQKYFAYFHDVYKKILKPESEEEEESKVKNFECDMCQKRYIYKTSLKKHILVTHLGQSPDTVICSYCGKTLSSKLNLKSHIEFVHEALFVSCPVCKKRINFRTIGKHYKTHRNSDLHSKNSFLCNLCGKVLKSKRSFEDHQKLHKNIRDELCDVCGSGFTTKKCLRLHKKTHEGVQRKVFGCDQCEKVFSGRHTLNRHLLTHSGKKNFVCEICSKCFYTLQELNRHVRYHRKEYRFDCQLCDMRFLDKSRFRHHMMRHRNVRPHKCQFCEKMFIVRGKMNLHMASKHNVEVQNLKGVWKDPKTYVPLDDLL